MLRSGFAGAVTLEPGALQPLDHPVPARGVGEGAVNEYDGQGGGAGRRVDMRAPWLAEWSTSRTSAAGESFRGFLGRLCPTPPSIVRCS